MVPVRKRFKVLEDKKDIFSVSLDIISDFGGGYWVIGGHNIQLANFILKLYPDKIYL